MGSDVEVAAVQLPGRQERLNEPALRDAAAMVDGVLESLDTLRPAPTVVLGVSFGGQLAWELAARLIDRGQTTRLFALATRAPQLPPRQPLLHPLDQAGFLSALEGRYGVSMDMLRNPELWSIAGPPLRADLYAMERRVHHDRVLPVPTTVIVGAADPGRPEQGAEVWSGAVSGPLDALTVEGGHFFVDSHRAAVMRLVRERLG